MGSSRGRPWGETMAVRGDFPVAVRGEFRWPSLGNSDGRPWGILMAAYGAFAMAVDTLCISRSRMAPATTGSPNTSPQAGRPLLVVTRVGWPFS